jgi:hypothetical protein
MAGDANSQAIAGTQTDSVRTDLDAELVDLVGYEPGKGLFHGTGTLFSRSERQQLDLRDPTWKQGMAEPPFEEIVRS